MLRRLVTSFPGGKPRLMFRCAGRYTVIALSWQVFAADQAAGLMAKITATPSLAPNPVPSPASAALPFGLGWFGILNYDPYAIISAAQVEDFRQGDTSSPGIVAYIHKSLVIDHDQGNAALVAHSPSGLPDARTAVDAEAFWPWRQILAAAKAPAFTPVVAGLNLTAGPDADYLAAVAVVKADIEAGRFYQLNLLRFFSAADTTCLNFVSERFLRFYEPYSLWFRYDTESGSSEELVSFSPERFVAIEPAASQGAAATLIAEPIKGTMGRGATKAEDEALKAALAQSRKDHAELHMIVDLLRHDMWPLCQPHSITVRHAHRLRTFARVHHLVATIAGALKPGLSLSDFWAPLLPAGSITGTPKREVMTAIRQLEGRDRGPFMGVAFHFNPWSGALDSSVLIRTLWRQGARLSYAAGSGLTIRSDARAELAEISQKCRVVTDALG